MKTITATIGTQAFLITFATHKDAGGQVTWALLEDGKVRASDTEDNYAIARLQAFLALEDWTGDEGKDSNEP